MMTSVQTRNNKLYILAIFFSIFISVPLRSHARVNQLINDGYCKGATCEPSLTYLCRTEPQDWYLWYDYDFVEYEEQCPIQSEPFTSKKEFQVWNLSPESKGLKLKISWSWQFTSYSRQNQLTIMSLIDTATTSTPLFYQGPSPPYPKPEVTIALQYLDSDDFPGYFLQKTIHHKNFVIQTAANSEEQLVAFKANLYLEVSIYDVPIDEVNPFSFAFDRLFVIRQENLNQNFIDINPNMYYLDKNTVAGVQTKYTLLPAASTPQILSSEFNDDAVTCSTRSNTAIGDKVYLTQYMVTGANPNEPIAIISSVFIQIGPQHTDAFEFYVATASWIAGTWSQNSLKLLFTHPAGNSPSFHFYDFNDNANFPSGPQPLVYSNFEFTGSTNVQQICNIQWFGHSFCQSYSSPQSVQPFVKASSLSSIELFKSGELRPSFVIGTILTYYETYHEGCESATTQFECLKAHPQFCHLGFKSGLKLDIIEGGLSNGITGLVTIPYSNTASPTVFAYTIDADTLDVTVFNFQAPTQSSGTSVQLHFYFEKDSRRPSSSPPISTPEYEILIDAAFGCCEPTQVQQATVSMIDGTPVPTNIDYSIGSGVLKLQYQINQIPTCFGYQQSNLKLEDSQTAQSVSLTSEASFNQCHKSSPQQSMCIYLDSQSGELLLYSDYQDVAYPLSTNYILKLSFEGFYSDGTPIIDGLAFNVQINQILDQSCYSAVFLPQLNEVLPLTMSLEAIPGNYSKQILFLNESAGISSSDQKKCGKRTFDLVAKSSDPNYDLANQMVNCVKTSHICLTTDDGFQIVIEASAQETQFVGQTLVFELLVGLKFFNPTPARFEVKLKVKEASQKIVEFRSTVSTLHQMYYIGLINKPISLKQYYFVQSGYHVAQIEATLTSGPVSSESYSVNSTSLEFQIDLSDTKLNGTVLDFNICAYLNTLEANCSLQLLVSLVAATQEQIKAHNTPPKFTNGFDMPEPIPCLDQNAARTWNYTFPKAVDKEHGQIDQQLRCKNITGFPFQVMISDDTMTLKLESNYTEPLPESFMCEVSISDQYSAKSTSFIGFKNGCFQFKGSDKGKFQPDRPKPVIKSISSQGEVLIAWNTELIIPDEFYVNRRMQEFESTASNCFKDALDVKIVPGAGSVYSSLRDLNFDFNITKFKSNLTTLQLNFSTPAQVSAEKNPDLISLSIKNADCFKSLQGVSVNQSLILKLKLPRQHSGGVYQLPSSAQTVIQGLTVVCTFALVLSFFLQGFLNRILSSVVTLGVVFHMFLVTLNYPQEMMDFFALFFPLITFDALPVDSFYQRVFKFNQIETDEALTDQFDNAGYSSIFLVRNVGSLFVVGLLELVIALLLWLARKFKPCKTRKIQASIDQTAGNTLWNGLIELLAGNYMVLSTVAFIESKNLRLGSQYSQTENFCSTLAVATIGLSLFFPLFIFILYKFKLRQVDPNYKRSEKIEQIQKTFTGDCKYKCAATTELKQGDNLFFMLLRGQNYIDFMKTYGSLIKGLRIRKIGVGIAILTPIIDLLLKLLIAVSVTRLTDWPILTIFIFNFSTLFTAEFVIYFQPYEERVEKLRATFNALTYLALNYHLLMFTDFVHFSFYPQVANSVIFLVWLSVGFNILLTVFTEIQSQVLKLKTLFLKRKMRKRQAQALKKKQTQPKVQTQQEKMAEIKLAFSVLDQFERPKTKRKVKTSNGTDLEDITDEDIEVHLSSRNVSPYRRYESDEETEVHRPSMNVSPMGRKEESDQDIADYKQSINLSPMIRREESLYSSSSSEFESYFSSYESESQSHSDISSIASQAFQVSVKVENDETQIEIPDQIQLQIVERSLPDLSPRPQIEKSRQQNLVAVKVKSPLQLNLRLYKNITSEQLNRLGPYLQKLSLKSRQKQ